MINTTSFSLIGIHFNTAVQGGSVYNYYVYKAYPGKTPLFSGGVYITGSRFGPVQEITPCYPTINKAICYVPKYTVCLYPCCSAIYIMIFDGTKIMFFFNSVRMAYFVIKLIIFVAEIFQ